MAKGRSPNYPNLTLEESLERIKKVYKDNHTYPTTKDIVAKSLGYGSLNGGSLKVIGALKRYGLLENAGENLKVTDSAVSILELPEDDKARLQALKDAAFHTDLFSEIHETYGDKLPNDALVKHFLVKKDFLPKAAEDVVRVYKANLELLGTLNQKYNAPRSEQGGQDGNMQNAASNVGNISPDRPNKYEAIRQQAIGPPTQREEGESGAGKIYTFPIARGLDAKVIFTSPDVTQEAIDKLSAQLLLSKDIFPTKAELEAMRADDESNSLSDSE